MRLRGGHPRGVKPFSNFNQVVVQVVKCQKRRQRSFLVSRRIVDDTSSFLLAFLFWTGPLLFRRFGSLRFLETAVELGGTGVGELVQHFPQLHGGRGSWASERTGIERLVLEWISGQIK